MRCWLIGDTHFGHALLEDEGFRPKGFSETLWRNLEAEWAMRAEDILIHLGDVCIGNEHEVHARLADLSCGRVLVRGNHDKRSLSWYSGRWDFVCDRFELDYMGQRLVFSHQPTIVDGSGVVCIHGHAHQTLPYGRYLGPERAGITCNFRLEGSDGSDRSRLRPVLLKTFLKECKVA